MKKIENNKVTAMLILCMGIVSFITTVYCGILMFVDSAIAPQVKYICVIGVVLACVIIGIFIADNLKKGGCNA